MKSTDKLPPDVLRRIRKKVRNAAWNNNKRAHFRFGRPHREKLTPTGLKKSLAEAHYRCECCGCTDLSKLGFDHVIPLKFDGANLVSNGQWLCDECNRKKGTNDYDYRKANRIHGMPYAQWIATKRTN